MDPSPHTLDVQTQKQSAKTGGESTRDRGHPKQPLDPSQQPKPHGDAEFWPLSGKPYFYVVLGQSQVAKRFHLAIPSEMSDKLPTAKVPAKIVYRGKVWDLLYHGDVIRKRFENEAWGRFVADNRLGVGDACVFELLEGSSKSRVVKFKVQILRDDFPSELLEKAEGSKKNPITID